MPQNKKDARSPAAYRGPPVGETPGERDRSLEAVMEQSPVPLLVFYAPDMLLGYGNRAALEASGALDEQPYTALSPAEIVRKQSWLLLSSNGGPVAEEDHPLTHVLNGTTMRNRELLIQRKDGSRHWFSFSVTPIHDAAGGIRAMAMVFPDITERKRDIEALQYRRDLEHLISGISTRFVNCTPEDTDAAIQDALGSIGRFTRADRSYLFFFRQSERVMDNTHEWCAPGIEPQMSTLQGRRTEEFGSFYQPILRSETVLIPRVSAMPLEPDAVRSELDRQGIRSLISVPIVFRKKVVGFLGLDAVRQEASWASDVDSLLRIIGELCANALDHKRTNEALRLSEERYRFVSDLGNHLLYDYSIPANRLEWMGRIPELTGYDAAELSALGVKAWEILVHPDDTRRAMELTEESRRGRTPYLIGYRFRRKDGTYMPVEDRGAFFYGEDGTAIRMVGSMTDMTERNMLQDQLQQAMKMEAVGRLAGGVAHDFNNLLTAIMGNVELARSMEGDAGGVLRCLAEISRAAESAAALTRQLLAFSRRQLIEPRLIDLNDLVTRLELMLRRLIGEDVSLQTKLVPALGIIKADPGQMEQVLVNLAVNARDAMPGGGSLMIGTANVELDMDYCRTRAGLKPGPYVRLSVADTGCGMSEEVKRHLFEPFFTTKPQGRGTGLGLATIFGIVKQAGGCMDVSSETGQGTTFRIHLPRVAAEAAAPAVKSTDSPLSGSETILLVEDEEGVRHLAVAVLARLGYAVLSASGGVEALQMAREHVARIDMLLTDVVMPGLNGRELADLLTKIHPEMGVLYTSGYTEDQEVLRGVVDTQLHFIAKPYSPRTLAAKIREVLENLPR
jgi:PAS domain S-box-containing protein